MKSSKPRRYSAFKRGIAALAVLTFLAAMVAMIFVGLNLLIITLLALSLIGTIGPAATEGASSIGDLLSGFFEIIAEAIGTIFGFFADLFSGFG